ncbi:hypothetical protein [Streptomyces sp. NBC_00564]|uniref:hypothetical protein n=1 Tax=Streptomyces sp. NBC_00564 TaxID=2903663 RepID=UPI002FCD9F3A|nr:hypothetical protein OG256_45805 [Streptomyces sp. NBC_00564]
MSTQDSHGGHGAPAPRPGRKFGPLRNHSQEYDTLARFLRTRVEESGLTVADLVGPTGLSKSAVSERLAGAKLTAEFVDAVVVSCTKAARLPQRARLRSDAARLLGIAQERNTPVPDLTRHSPAVRNTAMAAMETAQRAQEELLDVHRELRRMSDEIEALTRIQYQSRLALNEATTLASALSTWVIVLANEVEQLTVERELSMTARPSDLPRLMAVDAELAGAVDRRDRTAATLARTDLDRQLATSLLAEALIRTRRVRQEMGHLRAAAALPAVHGAPADTPAESNEGMLPPGLLGDDIDAALERTETVSRQIADRLSGALTALDPGAETLPLPDAPAADNADNTVTSADAADNTRLWVRASDVDTPVFLWAEQTAEELLSDRNPLDARFAEAAQTRPPRDVLLLADRLEYRWLEGASRLRLTLARSLDARALGPVILAVLDAKDSEYRARQGAQMLQAALWDRPASDIVALNESLHVEDGVRFPAVRTAFRVLVTRRPYDDILAMLKDMLRHGARDLHTGILFEACVQYRTPTEVADLVAELRAVDDVIGFVVFTALRVPPVGHTELLVRLRNVLDPGHFGEMLPTLYREPASDLASHIAELHRPWPDGLDAAARALRDDVMPLIIRGSSLDTLAVIETRLQRSGLSAEEIFGPYAGLFPQFQPGAD